MESDAEHPPPDGLDGPSASPPPPASLEPSSPAPAPAHELLPAHPPSTLFLVVVTAVSLAADLATKGWAKYTLSGYDQKLKAVRRLTLVKDHIDFIFAQNPGGAWSFLRSMPDSLRRPFFLTVSAAAIVFIVSIYRRILPEQRAMKWGLPLALGGAMGNLVDRIRYGWVVDFIDVYVVRGGREHHWPTFNVADIAIVIGVALMAISMLSAHGPRRADALKGEPASAAVPPAG